MRGYEGSRQSRGERDVREPHTLVLERPALPSAPAPVGSHSGRRRQLRPLATGGSAAAVLAAALVIAHVTDWPHGDGQAAAQAQVARVVPAAESRNLAVAPRADGPSPAGALSITTMGLPAATAYLEAGYNGSPQWRRIDTAVAPAGGVRVAWQAPDGVHVTSLGSAAARAGTDVVIRGSQEVGGLVAHDDGFALLTRLPGRSGTQTDAHLIRFRGAVQAFDLALTGSASQDAAPQLGGQLAWNGSRYGAYFAVHGTGGRRSGRFGDKLVYVDRVGRRLPGGWDWGCSHNRGTALIAEKPGAFTSLCVEDRRSGLFVNTGTGSSEQAPVISREQCRPDYCGGQIGGFVKAGSGRYVVAFSTRGAGEVRPGSGGGYEVTARTATHQVALAFLSGRSTPEGSPVLLTRDPDTDHVNVRLAPYGPDRLLVSYETVTGARCSSGTCTGTFAGTHVRITDLAGHPLTPDTVIGAHIAGSIGVLPGGDLIWAAAGSPPDHTRPLNQDATPTTSAIDIVRLTVRAG